MEHGRGFSSVLRRLRGGKKAYRNALIARKAADRNVVQLFHATIWWVNRRRWRCDQRALLQ
jgi:hypothetical protein